MNLSDADYENIVHKADTLRVQKMEAETAQKIKDLNAKNFTLKNLKGETVSLASLKGKVVVVDFGLHGADLVKRHFQVCKKW